MNKSYKAILRYGIAAILVFTPVARGGMRIWSAALLAFVEAALIFLWLWKMGTVPIRGEPLFRRTALDAPLLMFAFFAINSFAFSIYKHDSFFALLKILGYIGVYYMIMNEFNSRALKRLLEIAVFTGGGISCYGLLQYFGFLGHSWWVPKEFLSATYVNHNNFAGYLELVIPVAIAMLFKRNLLLTTYYLRLAGLISALVVMMAAFILSQSRGAWISLALSFFIVTAFVKRKKAVEKKTILFIALFLLAALSLIYFGREIIVQRVGSIAVEGAGDVSLATRLKIWQGALKMIAAHPLAGVGIGDFVWGFPRFRPEGLNVQANLTHNDYLNVAAETGVFGLAVIFWLLSAAIRAGIKKAKTYTLAFGCLVGVVSLSLHGLADFNFQIPANMLLFIIYLAILAKNNSR